MWGERGAVYDESVVIDWYYDDDAETKGGMHHFVEGGSSP